MFEFEIQIDMKIVECGVDSKQLNDDEPFIFSFFQKPAPFYSYFPFYSQVDNQVCWYVVVSFSLAARINDE